MMRRLCLGSLVVAILAGCSSAPDHFYVLPVIPDSTVPTPAGYFVEVLPVAVPEALDRAQLVVQQDNSRVALFEHALWAGSLKSELREALVRELARHGVRDVYGSQQPAGATIYRVQLTVDSLRVWERQTGLWQASWTLRSLDGKRATLCSGAGSVPPAGSGSDGVAAVYGAAAAAVDAQVAAKIRQFAAGVLPAGCVGL
jgi:uncharacterized lipoprotein YmbA